MSSIVSYAQASQLARSARLRVAAADFVAKWDRFLADIAERKIGPARENLEDAFVALREAVGLIESGRVYVLREAYGAEMQRRSLLAVRARYEKRKAARR